MDEERMKTAKYKSIGLRLRNIRVWLNWTLDAVSKATGISRSYISDFERGFKLPTMKYLTYLHDTHNVSLNYILGSDEQMLRPVQENNAKPDFGKYADDVEELIFFIANVPHAMFAILGFFAQYKVEHKPFLKKYFEEKEGVEEQKAR